MTAREDSRMTQGGGLWRRVWDWGARFARERLHPCEVVGHRWGDWRRYSWIDLMGGTMPETGEIRFCERCDEEQYRRVEYRAPAKRSASNLEESE